MDNQKTDNKSSVNKVRLMQVVPDLCLGGLQQVVVNLCRKIDRETYDVSVLCLNELGPFAQQVEDLGIEVTLLPQIEGNDYLAFLKVAKIFREKKIQILHTHNTQPFLDSVMASFISGIDRIIHTDHARNFPDFKHIMVMEWIASHFVDHIIGVSEHTSQNLHTFEKISKKKIDTIPNGIDESMYDFTIDKEELKKELGISNSGPVIGLGVRLCEQKGITYLLKAMPGVLRQHPDVTLVIAGEGPLRETLEKETAENGISDNVVFIGPRQDMPQIIKMLDLYVLPSIWEGLPMVILEALAAGCPILATDVGGNSNAIQHRFNGSLIPSEDPSLLEREINHLLSNPELLQEYVKNGHDIFHSKFSAEKMTRRYEALYQKN